MRFRVAVVTPYFREDRPTLERCIESVRRQTVKADHFIVADGFAQNWIDQAGVRHIRLDQPYGDAGGTPRAIGSILAAADQYDAIALLDADNWYDAVHVEYCMEAARMTGNEIDYVVARRRLVRPDGSIIDIPQEPIEDHVDTSCYFLLNGSYHMLSIWALIPKPIAPIHDRIFYAALKTAGLRKAISERTTVNYQCMYAMVYQAIGEQPPPGAKPNFDGSQLKRWRESLSPRDLVIAERLMHLRLQS
jgi:glycosyltransferase involved in cell wall biosynthesis